MVVDSLLNRHTIVIDSLLNCHTILGDLLFKLVYTSWVIQAGVFELGVRYHLLVVDKEITPNLLRLEVTSLQRGRWETSGIGKLSISITLPKTLSTSTLPWLTSLVRYTV